MPDKKKEELADQDDIKIDLDAEKTISTEEDYEAIKTADGKKLKKIDGGYTISGTGTNPDESDFVSV